MGHFTGDIHWHVRCIEESFMRWPMRQCLRCKHNGEPWLVQDRKVSGEPVYYIECDQCNDDMEFFKTKDEALDFFLKKFNHVA